jgi:hypothetical protein
MAVIVNFSSPGNPPHNIVGFNVERSLRPASGTIALLSDINNVTKVVAVTFIGTPPAAGELAGDQMHISGSLYRILTNTTSSITFTPDVDLSTITSFPASFVILNDLAEFSSFELVGSVTPTVPFTDNTVHQFSDATGTIFDFYRIRSVDSVGTVSPPISRPFRPGQVVNLAIGEERKEPKDALIGVIGGSITFEVTVMVGGRRQDPKDNIVYADLFAPSYVTPNHVMTLFQTLTMVRVGLGKYRVTWTVPTNVPQNAGGFPLIPGNEYVVSYKANFTGLLNQQPQSVKQFDSEFFTIQSFDGPVFGRFPAYATIDDLRMTFFNIDEYLPEALDRTDLEGRNAILQYHLEQASDKLREEMNLAQVRASSADRKEYVATRAVYSLFLASRGQKGAAISEAMIKEWKEKAEYILAQIKREGVAQGIPLGRG